MHFPTSSGYADETGAVAGEGATANYPLPPGTAWSHLVRGAGGRARPDRGRHGAEALVVSLGTDAFERDPISFFKLTSDDFCAGRRSVGRAGLPTCLCLEGGYAIERSA